MRKLIATLLVALTFSAHSAEYEFVIPNPPGSAADTVGRTIAEEYHRQTGNSLILEYAPGADHVIAATKFKTKKLAVSLGTTTMHIFNHVYRDSIPYTDSDFNIVGFLGWIPAVWYTAADSQYNTMQDILEAMASNKNVFVGVDAFGVEVNVTSLIKNNPHGKQINIIKYKGSAQTLTDVLGRHVDLAIGSVSEMIVNNATAGRIRILSTSNDTPIMINGRTIPTSDKLLNVPQFNGGFILAVTPGESAELQQLRKDLLKTMASDAVRSKLKAINIEVEAGDAARAQEKISQYRQQLRLLK